MSSTPDPLPGFGLAAQDDALRSATGRNMGASVTPKKRKAVRVNGKSGGRPVRLGVLRLKYEPDTPHIQVKWSRSYGGLVFTKPDGSREFFAEGACGTPEEGLYLMRHWFHMRHDEFLWFPFYGPTWKYKTAKERKEEKQQ